MTEGFALKPIMTKSRRRKARRDAVAKICGVYFFEAKGSDLIKIGRSSNVGKRICEVKGTTGAPEADLAIWGVIECDRENLPRLEKAMHQAFSGTRVAGEWFEARKDLALHQALSVAHAICGDRFRVRGLGSDVTPADEPNWKDPADNLAKIKRRAYR